MLFWHASCSHAEFIKFSLDNDDVCENVLQLLKFLYFFFKLETGTKCERLLYGWKVADFHRDWQQSEDTSTQMLVVSPFFLL